MKLDLTAMNAIMENDKFALYIVTELAQEGKYKGIRLDKRTNAQVEVYIEKTKEKYPPYRVTGFCR